MGISTLWGTKRSQHRSQKHFAVKKTFLFPARQQHRVPNNVPKTFPCCDFVTLSFCWCCVVFGTTVLEHTQNLKFFNGFLNVGFLYENPHFRVALEPQLASALAWALTRYMKKGAKAVHFSFSEKLEASFFRNTPLAPKMGTRFGQFLRDDEMQQHVVRGIFCLC